MIMNASADEQTYQIQKHQLGLLHLMTNMMKMKKNMKEMNMIMIMINLNVNVILILNGLIIWKNMKNTIMMVIIVLIYHYRMILMIEGYFLVISYFFIINVFTMNVTMSFLSSSLFHANIH